MKNTNHTTQHPRRNVLGNALKLVYQCHAAGFVLKVFYTALGSLLPLANLFLLKMLVDGVTQGVADGMPFASIVPYVVAFSVVFFVGRVVGILSVVNSDRLSQRLIDYISDQIQRQSMTLDMAYYDNPDYHDTFHRAQQEANYRPIRILDDFTNFVGSIISIVGVVAMLCSASWLTLVVMVVAIIPTFVVRLVKSRKLFAFRRENTQHYRRSHYLSTLLTDSAYAKEIRSFSLGPFFRSQFVTIRRQLVDKLIAISRRLAVIDGVSAVLETIALVTIVGFLLYKAYAGAITVGAFVMLFEAFRRGQQNLQTMASSLAGLYDSKLFIGNLFEFMELRPKIVSPSNPVAIPDHVQCVEFRDITFSYPCLEPNTTENGHAGKPAPVLKHFSMICAKGEISWLRGENGFGKTTLLKLLLRLYDPDEGSILINDIDIRKFDLTELRRQVSAIFQDHVRFYFTAQQNIQFGDIDAPLSTERLHEASRFSQAQSVIDKLPKGYDTQLGRIFNQGQELSMGQWQRIALARQLYSNAPILVFDEPTAWMDKTSRERFLENLETIKRNHVVILIAHL